MKHRGDYVDIPRIILERLYAEGLTQKDIGKRFGVTEGTIKNRMAEYGMKTRTAQDYLRLDIPKEKLEQLYVVEGRYAPEVAAILGCEVTAVYNYMERYGIPRRPLGSDKTKRIVPEHKLAWSAEFAYVVGLIASDGNLQTGCNEVRMVSTDRQIVDLYCQCLGLRPNDIAEGDWPDQKAVAIPLLQSQRPPYKRQYSVIFSDHRYRARLEEIGLIPNKSRTLGPLQVPDLYFRDFLRGEFDGDGCWSVARRPKRDTLLGLFTSGSRPFLQWIQATLERLGGTRGGWIRNIELRYQGNPAEQLGRFLYYAKDLPCLSRKRDKWTAWMIDHNRNIDNRRTN